jgi:hypothetical protein
LENGMKPLPEPESLRRSDSFGLPDLAVILGVLALLGVIAHVGAGAMVSFRPPDVSPTVSLDPRNLPDYAARSTLRMFIALAASLLFTLIYGSTVGFSAGSAVVTFITVAVGLAAVIVVGVRRFSPSREAKEGAKP